MTLDQAANIINIFQFGLLVKLFLSTLVLFYLVLTVVIYRQIVLMTQILDSRISPTVKAVALGQIISAGILFFLALVLA